MRLIEKSPRELFPVGIIALFCFMLPIRPCGPSSMPRSWGLSESGWVQQMLFRPYPLKNEIIRVIPHFLQMGTLHIVNAVLKERDGRYKTFRALRNFYDQNRFLLHGIHSCEIRFKRIFSCYGVNRQRQERYPESSVCKFPFYCKNPLKSKRI